MCECQGRVCGVLGGDSGPEWVSLVSPVAWETGARRGALPQLRGKQRCTHHMEVDWSQAWLGCWPEASRSGIQEEEKRGWGVCRGTG